MGKQLGVTRSFPFRIGVAIGVAALLAVPLQAACRTAGSGLAAGEPTAAPTPAPAPAASGPAAGRASESAPASGRADASAPARAAAPRVVRPPSADAADSTRVSYTAADVRFMQHMMVHHAQAVAMTALVPERSTNDDVRLLAERMAVSQRDEIALMRRWLEDRGATVPALSLPALGDSSGAMAPMPGMPGMSDMPAGDSMPLMPGMLTPAELRQMARSTGPTFDRLFLRGMIQHHEGALRMVERLFHTPGAAQESEVYAFATDVDAVQRAEIARMRGILSEMSPADSARE